MTRMLWQGVVHVSKAVFYVHEAALHLKVGDARIMQDQMLRLAFRCGWARVSPRVIPLSTGSHPALRHSVTLMTVGVGLKPVAYAETDVATVFVDEREAIKVYEDKYAALAALALSVEESNEVFAMWAEVYDRVES